MKTFGIKPDSYLRIFITAAWAFSFASIARADTTDAFSVTSPNGQISVALLSDTEGQLFYTISQNDMPVLRPSRLGIRFKTALPLDTGLRIESPAYSSFSDSWEQPWGERRIVRNVYNEMAAEITTDEGTQFTLRIRVYDDGIGFRYEVPDQPGYETVEITDELTEFNLAETDARAWWIPAQNWHRYENLYRETSLDGIDRAHTPLTLRTASGLHISIHEAALINYSAMSLESRRSGGLEADLTPWSDGVKVKASGGFITPWRTIQISETAAGLINSDLILNLNEPNKLGDVSWVRPGKYVGIWWAMHLKEKTWATGPDHGATTQETKRYIDFAAANGFDGVLVEGWNVGWDGDWFNNGDVFSFTQSTDDFDLLGVAEYAKSKGVRLIGHHETSGSVTNYEQQLEEAFSLYARLGVDQVKTGYVADLGDIKRLDADGIARYEQHDGQYMVDHHLRVLKQAAKQKISINAHEPVKDTGLRRTYPNALTREGARGQEYNAWGNPVNPPDHEVILTYTRMLSGPMDYTPGIVDLIPFGPDNPHRVKSTLAKQLALYVVLYSPIHMAADLPKNYEDEPDAFEFIKEVPTDWNESIALAGEIGDFTVIARQKRNSETWYLGAITDENSRVIDINLDFLSPYRTYNARIFRDGDTADWQTAPYDMLIEETALRTGETISLKLAPGGGTAIIIEPAG